MTPAVATPSSASPRPSQTVPIVILGTDALLAALPATPVQLAHACLRAGFANAIPASWGDELIAAAVLRRLPDFAGGPAIQCSCPIVAHRLLSVGGDLRPAMLGFVSPPVALARYVRALSAPTPVRITYVGGCPGANDESIDIRMRPDSLLALLAERDIVLEHQPRVFESILPPDRRRFRSQPGGVPTAESLWSEVGARTLVEVDGDDFVTELAQQLLTGKNVLIDAATHLGCVCSGAVAGVGARGARSAVVSVEPPRAMMPVVEEHAPIELELALPAAPRAPGDVAAAIAGLSPPRGVALAAAAPASSASSASPPSAGHRYSPVRAMAAIPDHKVLPRASGPSSLRAVLGAAPITRDGEGRALPRAYVARRRPSPRGVPAVAVADHPLKSPVTRPARAVARPPADAALGLPPAPAAHTAPAASAVSSAPTASAPALDSVVTTSSPASAPASPVEAPSMPSETLARGIRSLPIPPADAAEPSRSAGRPRPSMKVERATGFNLSARRLILLGAAALLLCVVMSMISAYVVARVVRSDAPQATSAAPGAAPPTVTKP